MCSLSAGNRAASTGKTTSAGKASGGVLFEPSALGAEESELGWDGGGKRVGSWSEAIFARAHAFADLSFGDLCDATVQVVYLSPPSILFLPSCYRHMSRSDLRTAFENPLNNDIIPALLSSHRFPFFSRSTLCVNRSRFKHTSYVHIVRLATRI